VSPQPSASAKGPPLEQSYLTLLRYQVPISQWSLFQKALESETERNIPITSGFLQLFRHVDLYYFLFNPPTLHEHPSDDLWKYKYAAWIDTSNQTGYGSVTAEEVKGKYQEVKTALTLWETGGSQALRNMTPNQIGFLRTFHPLYPDSHWNHPLQCLELGLTGDTYVETFCRWRSLIHFSGYTDITEYSGYYRQGIEGVVNSVIASSIGNGSSYASTLKTMTD